MTSSTPDDSGFTLIEILIATMITAVVLTVLTASFLIFFQNSAYTSGRDDHAAGAEALSAWLDRDLASATNETPPVVQAASACTASPVLLSVFWRQYAAGTLPNSFPTNTGSLYKASYAYVPDSLNASRCMITRSLYKGTTPANVVQQGTTLELIHDLVGSSAASQANLLISTANTATCSSPNKAVNVTLTQYHASATASDAAIPYKYFGCVNARTNALPTP